MKLNFVLYLRVRCASVCLKQHGLTTPDLRPPMHGVSVMQQSVNAPYQNPGMNPNPYQNVSTCLATATYGNANNAKKSGNVLVFVLFC